MDLIAIISVIMGGIALFFTYKTFYHSYRDIEFSLSKKSMDKLNSTSKRELFSGLEDIEFSFTNKSTKPIVIENIVIEKAVQPLAFQDIKDHIIRNFHVLYHFYVSEKSFKKELKIVYGEKTQYAGTRKYNLLEDSFTVSPSEKKLFYFKKEQQFRELFYIFDGSIHAFSIINIYVKDTLGNVITLSKDEKNAFIKASSIDSQIIEVFLNRFASTKLASAYLYFLSKDRKKDSLNDNHSTKAMSSYLQSEDYDIDDDMSKEVFELGDDISEMVKKDNILLEESLKQPLSEDEIKTILFSYNGKLNFSDIRKKTIEEIKELQKEYPHLYD